MVYYYKILKKEANEIISDSQDFMRNTGFGEEDHIEGWSSLREAHSMGIDELKRDRLPIDEYEIIITPRLRSLKKNVEKFVPKFGSRIKTTSTN